MTKEICLLLCLALTGCSARQQFDCPYKEGARCLSVGEIDQKINAGQLGQDKTSTESIAKKLDMSPESNISPTSLRTTETVLMAWIAPYYTTDGVYHEATRIHFVAKAPSWLNVNPEVMGDPQ